MVLGAFFLIFIENGEVEIKKLKKRDEYKVKVCCRILYFIKSQNRLHLFTFGCNSL